MSKEGRVSYVEDLSNDLDGVSFILVDYSGVLTSGINKLRSGVKSLGGVCKVVRNRLFHRSLSKVGVSLDMSSFVGMNLLVGCSSDKFFEISKVVLNSEKENIGKIKVGFFEGSPVDVSFIKKMANIPSRDVLYSILVGALLSPLSSLVFVLQSIADDKSKEENA